MQSHTRVTLRDTVHMQVRVRLIKHEISIVNVRHIVSPVVRIIFIAVKLTKHVIAVA